MTDALTIHIYTSEDTLPAGLMEENFFQSPAFFHALRQTPRHRPYMVTLETAEGTVASQLLAVVRYRSSLLPPYFYMHCRVMGEGCYLTTDEEERSALFERMLSALTSKMNRRVLYIEISHLSQKMFGYRQLRQQHFFPVRWMSIHNSLHSIDDLEERMSSSIKKHVKKAHKRGVTTCEVKTEADFNSFTKLLRHHNWLKPRRFIPNDQFFALIGRNSQTRLYVTKYRQRVIGGSVVVFSGGQAYLWYAAYRRKVFSWLHPAEATVYHAISDAHRQGCDKIFFMDVGLPYRKNPFREFILRFGGKPVSTYRWFRCSINWINRLLSWFYRE